MSEPQSLLQRFFDASLIPSDTTDERLAHYQAAAADLAKQFGKTPADAVSAIRVAIDPDCPATDPWFKAVEDAVKVHWKTFLIKNNDAPRQICRAILLEALSNAAEDDMTLTLAIWYASSSLLPHLGNGPELVVTREFIQKLGDECENHSSSEWRIGTAAADDLPEFEIKLPAMKATEVNETELTNGFSDAAGPHNQQNQSFGNPNQYWPNQAQYWSYQFAPRAANVVATAVNKALAATSPGTKAISEQLSPALKKHANALGKWVVSSSERNERFTALLWWKQALYSPVLRSSYRQLSRAGTVMAMPFDLGIVSGAPVPLSVEHFLRESIRLVLPENPKLTLAELMAAIKTDDSLNPCLPLPSSDPPRRISVREFLSVARQGVPSNETIPSYVGVVASISLPASEWAVWLLRERLAELLTTPSKQK